MTEPPGPPQNVPDPPPQAFVPPPPDTPRRRGLTDRPSPGSIKDLPERGGRRRGTGSTGACPALSPAGRQCTRKEGHPPPHTAPYPAYTYQWGD
jgi:hypothetical protein